jgi:hypothetical protein
MSTDTLRAIAAFGLRTRHVLDPTAADVTDVTSLVSSAEQHGVLGQLAAAVRAGTIGVLGDERRLLEEHLRASLTRDLRAERLLVESVRALDRARIESRVTGPSSLGRTAYHDPSYRSIDRIDLLVRPDDLDRAERAVQSVAGDDSTVPVHVCCTVLDGKTANSVPVGELFAPPYRYPVGMWELEGLPMPTRLLDACARAGGSEPPAQLVTLRDVAQLVRTEQPNAVDVLMTASSWGCEDAVANALIRTWDELALVDQPPLVEWARRHRDRAAGGGAS